MKRKEKLNYMLREVYGKENYLIKEWKYFCLQHHVTESAEEFLKLVNELKDKGYVGIDNRRQVVYFRKPLVKEGICAGVYYNGTTQQLFFDPCKTWIQPIIS